MSAPTPIQDLVGEIAHLHPSAVLELSPLPSGVCFLWVSLNNRDFVIEYDPKRGTGVSENFPDTPLFVGHDEAYPTLEAAITRFRSLLAGAAKTESTSGAMALHDKPISH